MVGEIVVKLLFYINAFIIFWAIIGYPISIKILGKIYKKRINLKDYNNKPSVTIMVVAHNEEKVIFNKLNNIISLDYPNDKIEFIVASDNSTDRTNDIVKDFITNHKDKRIRLYEVKNRKGKTNAQNEASKLINTDFIVMTDANSILDINSINELMSSFTSHDIKYVTGKLLYTNSEKSIVSRSESNYWNNDLKIREIESRIQTITAGNGALYACRKEDYIDFDPIECHDSAMPLYFALQGKRALANHDAIAYEKAGETVHDEFKRKVRMNRVLLRHILPQIKILNFFKYKWFTYFYLGHRTFRYLLWIAHLLVFITCAILYKHTFYFIIFLLQILFYFLAILRYITKSNIKILTIIYYYTMTIVAQWIGVYNIITGKTKAFWDKAETTR